MILQYTRAIAPDDSTVPQDNDMIVRDSNTVLQYSRAVAPDNDAVPPGGNTVLKGSETVPPEVKQCYSYQFTVN